MDVTKFYHLTRDFLELIYFICTPILVIIGALGLKQIKISIEQLKLTSKSTELTLKSIETTSKLNEINSERDSYKLASEQGLFFVKEIIPLVDKISDFHIVSFGTYTLDRNDIYKSSFKLSDEFINIYNNNGEFSGSLTYVLNYLDAFSMYFISGIAEESILFATTGYVFCRNVEKYMPFVLKVGQDKCYDNILQLYLIWKNKIDKQKISSDMENLKKRYDNIKVKELEKVGYKTK